MSGTAAPTHTGRPEVDPHVDPGVDTEVGSEHSADRPWITIVWNDPVNLMSYVTYVFRKLFGYDEPTATELMLDVHHKGRAIVSSGPKEKMEYDTARLHAAGLWATYQQGA